MADKSDKNDSNRNATNDSNRNAINDSNRNVTGGLDKRAGITHKMTSHGVWPFVRFGTESL